jgi:hypothetical protein
MQMGPITADDTNDPLAVQNQWPARKPPCGCLGFIRVGNLLIATKGPIGGRSLDIRSG